RADESVRGLRDHDVLALRHDADGLVPHDGGAVLGPDETSLRLRNDLLRHGHDVARAEVRCGDRRRDHGTEVGAGLDLADALDGEDGDAAHTSDSATRAIDSATASLSITVSVTPARRPSASICGTSSRSRSSITQAEISPR